jgi:putative endonuclease
MSKRSIGTEGETLATDFLTKKGYTILERNYRFGRGEIDIIAEQGSDLVFIEVKSRRSAQYGSPEESVTLKKESQLKRVADGYLLERGIENQSCRFDVVAITFQKGVPEFHLIQNVFVA